MICSTLLELAGKDSVTGKVWFECTWLSAIFVMNLGMRNSYADCNSLTFDDVNSRLLGSICHSSREILHARSYVV